MRKQNTTEESALSKAAQEAAELKRKKLIKAINKREAKKHTKVYLYVITGVVVVLFVAYVIRLVF